jgi:hypothetical protein
MLSLVPEEERDEGWQLITSLFGLEQLTDAFKIAVQLFNFAGSELARARNERNAPVAELGADPHRIWKEKSAILFGWQHMAARDGALQIYHIGKIITKVIGAQLKNVPHIRCHVDSDKFKRATRLFLSSFPNYELIRDAVAHSHYELASSASKFRSHAPDRIDIAGLATGSGVFITNSLWVNKYIITKDKKVASFEISEASYAVLESVRTQFITGFDNARAEVAKNWPKPGAW